MLRIGTICIIFTFFFSYSDVQAQSYYFGFKGGLTVGTQDWGGSFSNREPLFRYHGIAFIETAEEDEPWGLFAQLGYHIKGSATRTFRQTITLPDGSARTIPAREIPLEFRNASLTAGAKQKFDLGMNASQVYYMLGVRLDYTLSTLLRPEFIEEDDPTAIYYPFDGFVNKFNYGITVGGGIDFSFSEFVGVFIELSVNPDFSLQYNQPAIRNLNNPNPFSNTQTTSISERKIRNTTFEITLGFRFLRKVIYIDE